MIPLQPTFPLTMRIMDRRDLREVLQIEADSFAHPWSLRDFAEHLDDHNSVALVIKQNSLIVGYEVFSIRPPWIQLHSCVVRRGFQRRGIGSQMMVCLASEVNDGQCTGILVKVPERQVGTQLFFRHCGFRAVKTLHAYLEDEQDVYVMQYGPRKPTVGRVALETPEDELIPFWAVKHG